MRAWNIDSFIEANKLAPGDVVLVEQLVLGIRSRFFVFLGRDRNGSPVFACNTQSGVRGIGVADMVRVFQQSAPTRIQRFQGNPVQRKAVLDKANANLNEDTYNLLLNWATPRQKNQTRGTDDAASVIGGTLLAAAAIALIAALFRKDDE